jgi:2-haloacid dehalogenase
MHTSEVPLEAVVFDIGGVLFDWDPRHLYRKLITDDAAMERFLREVCTPEWHAPHDLGAPTAESCGALASRNPELSDLIWAWSNRSEEMIGGVFHDSVEVLGELVGSGMPCFALTNMEAETYPLRRERYPFFELFEGVVVSGEERMAKPDPEIFRRLLERFGLHASSTLMIDDRSENIQAARSLGMPVELFRSAAQLRRRLCDVGALGRAAVRPEVPPVIG